MTKPKRKRADPAIAAMVQADVIEFCKTRHRDLVPGWCGAKDLRAIKDEYRRIARKLRAGKV